jgi:3-oxosteroid 1-dehydrogenase
MPPEADFETDVLVIGSGAGALTAAFVAAQSGARVLIVEKADCFGGTSATSGGGIWIPCSSVARRAGFEDSAESAHTYMKALIGEDVSDERIRAYIDNAPRMLDFLEDNSEAHFVAANYADYHMDEPGAKEGGRTHDPVPVSASRLGADFWRMRAPHPLTLTFGRFTWTMAEAQILMTASPGHQSVLFKLMASYALDIPWRFKSKRSRRLTGGNALIAALKLSIDKKNIPLWLNSPMKELIVEEGRVTGAVVVRDGKTVRVKANKGVIIAAGGFDHNPELRARYSPKPSDVAWASGSPSDTGDALVAGLKVGAKTALMDSAWWAPGFKLADEDRSRPMFVERALPGSIIINQAGKRYMNEAASYHLAGSLMHEKNSPAAPTVPSWFVFDSRYRGKYMLGTMTPATPDKDDKILPSMRAILKRADTVEELAAQIGVDAKALSETFERFNRGAVAGVDDEFERGKSAYDRHYGDKSVSPNPTLAPLAKPPFYAIPIYPCDLGTNGGLLTDTRARVLAEDGRPIPGLYAIGNCSASVMGRTYPGAGATLGPAMTFGYVAARDATGQNF